MWDRGGDARGMAAGRDDGAGVYADIGRASTDDRVHASVDGGGGSTARAE